MHTLSLFAQAIGERLNLDHVSTAILIVQQIQLAQMKVKINALWENFLGAKENEDKD